jgi:hypothetical protein
MASSCEGTATFTNKADTDQFNRASEIIFAARTQEEALIQNLLQQWRQGGHGFVPDVKGDNTIRLGCENANSLSLYHPTKSKLRKLLNLHNKYQTDGACILEHGTNFSIAREGSRPEDMFASFRGTRVAAAHNRHEQHSRYQQGGTPTAAFTCLASFVTSTGVDHTGLGRWSWIQVRTGEHHTRIVSAYQLCRGSSTSRLGTDGQLLRGGTVAAQHHQYF